MQTELELAPACVADNAIDTARRTSAVAARVERVFDAMRRIIEAPDSRLENYRQDFFKFDRAYLERSCAVGMYGWIVRQNGTHLVHVGHHPKMHEELEAALEMTSSLDCYLVDSQRASVTPVSTTQLRARMATLQYTVTNANVYRGETRIASIDVGLTPWRHGESPKGVVRLESAGAPLSLVDRVALAQIAESEVVLKSHSLFTGTQTITLDGEDLRDVIAQACA